MVVDVPTPRAMRSDRVIIPTRLRKVACETCGLVRNADRLAGFGQPYYEAEYGMLLRDHQFYTPDGPVSRSALFADWIASAVDASGAAARPPIGRVLEIGAGAGFLLGEVAQRFPSAQCEGLELSEAARVVARERGRPMLDRAVADIPAATYDLVYSVAVVEHVPSPTDFMSEMRRLLKPGGLLVLAQPTQDVKSYDILFADHVHHFASGHLAAYAAKIGCVERVSAVGYRCMPNFSLHLWSTGASSPVTPWTWSGPPVATTCEATAQRILGDMRRLDETIAGFDQEGRPFGVFGLYEVFALASSYSSLGTTRSIRCGLDDNPMKPEYRGAPFPVTTPEHCRDLGIADVLLTMNAIYYEAATARLAALGIRSYPVLS